MSAAIPHFIISSSCNINRSHARGGLAQSTRAHPGRPSIGHLGRAGSASRVRPAALLFSSRSRRVRKTGPEARAGAMSIADVVSMIWSGVGARNLQITSKLTNAHQAMTLKGSRMGFQSQSTDESYFDAPWVLMGGKISVIMSCQQQFRISSSPHHVT